MVALFVFVLCNCSVDLIFTSAIGFRKPHHHYDASLTLSKTYQKTGRAKENSHIHKHIRILGVLSDVDTESDDEVKQPVDR